MRGINFCELILQQSRNEFSAREVCQGNGGERRDQGQMSPQFENDMLLPLSAANF